MSCYSNLFIIFFVYTSTCFADYDPPYKEGELLVRFAPRASGIQRTDKEKNQFLSSINGAEVKRSYRSVPGLTVVKLSQSQSVADSLLRFRGKEEILYVEPNYKIKLDSIIPNDPCFVKQWALDNTGQTCSGSTCSTPDADIDAPEAWDIIHDAHNIIVAVTDTGVDYRHPDLAPNMWSLPIDFYGQFRV